MITWTVVPTASPTRAATSPLSTGFLAKLDSVYGLGGVVVPFIAIKAIDLVVQFIPGI